MAPCIAFCSSSIDDMSDGYADLVVGGAGGVNPARQSTPEWLGDDRIDDGQLDTQLFLLGYLKFPENECEITAVSFGEIGTASGGDLVLFWGGGVGFWFWESFSYKGLTFLRENLEVFLGAEEEKSVSSAAEEGREESQSGGRRRRSAAEKEERESLELLPVESREAVVVVSEEEEVEEDASRSVRTMERRGERWRGRSWPL
nr:hypothetical protein Iba_chr14fCG8590 [Ipomoea batatas]